MSRMEDFGDCLFKKDLQSLYALLHCLHQLHEALADDTTALAEHLEEQGQLLLRRCDICGENLSRHTVWELLKVLKATIQKREEELAKIGSDPNG